MRYFVSLEIHCRVLTIIFHFLSHSIQINWKYYYHLLSFILFCMDPGFSLVPPLSHFSHSPKPLSGEVRIFDFEEIISLNFIELLICSLFYNNLSKQNCHFNTMSIVSNRVSAPQDFLAPLKAQLPLYSKIFPTS